MVKTVMEKADEILANMGISDAVPLSESTQNSIHSVGKKYNQDLPDLSDSQRSAFLEGCGVISEGKKKDAVSKEISKLKDKGVKQDQAVAIALSMKEKGKLKTEDHFPEKHKPHQTEEEIRKMRPIKLEKVNEMGVVQGAPTGKDGRNFDNAWKLSKKDWEFFSGKSMNEDWRQDAFDAEWNEEDEDEYDEDKDKIEEKSPAWQRKEGKSKSGGLNRKGVASYRAANPGSKLKTAVTTKPSKLKKGSKAAKRRKSFCARMSGMKKRRTSAKTARDPNSRINKSLRKWNCNEGWRPVAESVTTVGNIGVNMAGGQPKPKKKKKNKLDKATNKFLTNKLNTLK
jgi:hypothetical protein